MSGIQRWECRVAINDNGRPYVDDIEYSAGRYVLHSDHEAAMSEQYAALIYENHDLYHDVNRLRDESDRLRAEVEAVRVDAERYRWLRDQPWRENEELEPVIRLHLNALWDDKIDAAMGASA